MTAQHLLAALDVSRETLARLETYEDLLRKWTARINLVSPRTLDALWTRHFLDSAQLLRLAGSGTSWTDLGSGGGFPGLVIAILAAEVRPDLRVTLVEADQRKAAFLRTVLRETAVSAAVVTGRIEEIAPRAADILSARALASLDMLLGYAERHMAPSGRALFPKGENVEREIAEALEHWRFRCERYPSITDANSTVLSIGEITRV